MRGDLLKVLDAAYRTDVPSTQWFQALVESCQPVLESDRGIAIGTFDASDLGAPSASFRAASGIEPGLGEFAAQAATSMTPEAALATFRIGGCVVGRKSIPFIREGKLTPWAVGDALAITASDPEGVGIAVCAFHSRHVSVSPRRRQLLDRMAAHVGAAFRLRRRLGGAQQGNIEAVLDPTGKVQEASGEATSKAAREVLSDAVRTIERLRGERAGSPDELLSAWLPVQQARWTLVDQCEHGGHRYILARENEPKPLGPEALTNRERQVVGFAALGHSSKSIAYELGISYATVRVLLSRAASKLGVSSRAELIAAFLERQ